MEKKKKMRKLLSTHHGSDQVRFGDYIASDYIDVDNIDYGFRNSQWFVQIK
jgi:hypothetical protein